MTDPASVQVQALSKTYQVPEREAGLGAAVRSFFQRKTKDVQAVREVSLAVAPGEIVGFLGPNGAGKTTTLKMLSGLLHPSGGSARVLGFTPWERKPDFLRAITLVMGQRNRLSWDIPAGDSLLLHQAVYRLSDAEFKRTVDELDELLELGPILKKPVRNLSLGERMKCELAAGLLHRPRVLFLDEPTIGLDLTAQARIRAFLKEYNRRTHATILLTSHYMADVTALCERIVIIHHGRLKYDGGLTDLSRRIAPVKLISVALPDGSPADLSRYGTVLPNEANDGKYLVEVPAAQVAAITARLLSDLPVHDLNIEDPPIEAVIESAFNEPAEVAEPLAGEPVGGP
ncbi:MAG: ATP-binding cassette domain-containing protein [Anaerolineales bacterium]|nr:ATP-binding cassette domain-containing protein [Anaerolineales bacterium]